MTRHDTQKYGMTRKNMAWHGTGSHDMAWYVQHSVLFSGPDLTHIPIAVVGDEISSLGSGALVSTKVSTTTGSVFNWRDGLGTLEKGPLERGPSFYIVGFQSPSCFFFFRKTAPIFLEAPDLCGRCSRLFFSRKMGPIFLEALNRFRGSVRTVGFESLLCAMNAHIPKAPFPRSLMRSPK